jgi:hypothetical protein
MRFDREFRNVPDSFSRHNTRVGAAQDMVRDDLADATQAGRWKVSAMVARYDSTGI